MSADLAATFAIVGMALATYATRLAGIYFMRGIVVRGRLKATLDALPPAVLMAVISPMVLGTGLAETLAALITAGAASLRFPLPVIIILGVGSVVVLRYFLKP